MEYRSLFLVKKKRVPLATCAEMNRVESRSAGLVQVAGSDSTYALYDHSQIIKKET